MNYNDLNDTELLQLITDTRKKLDSFEVELNQADNSVDKAAMRAEMTRLNHLKLEANKRSLDVN